MRNINVSAPNVLSVEKAKCSCRASNVAKEPELVPKTTSGTVPYKEDVGFGTTETRVRSTACLPLGELLRLPPHL